MYLSKLTNKSLVTNNDLDFNYRLGIPVEVFCSKQKKTIAFGQIHSFNDQMIQIHEFAFCRSTYLFFGQPAKSVLSKSS
ncbi:hypothetical protein [Halalkalibacter nanhaiisediminis]|uniref:Uncharacterized protein n=1 Tax=Halalkalibacter nanhaiisediminis TaxID=688079 RepID=A0A562QD29_9BACI|nr:hypothetical protein [Halalkalibacter nanhaiisediminis]TWI54609.1 hypothetical protein IQ10_02830 [Halalkalibacter nanhaiisediminis]